MPTSINTATAITLPSSYSLELPVAPPYNVSETRPFISSHIFMSYVSLNTLRVSGSIWSTSSSR